MAQWDETMKLFLSENMQDFASWVKKGAQAKRKRDTTFPGRKLEADILIEATLNEKEMLLHFEFQTNNDPNMPERLQESLPITYTLASLVFKNEADQEWLRKRFRQMQDILRDTPIYQEILKEGREEAREEARREAEEARRKALEEGREEGKLEALRTMLLDFIEARFPTRKMINLAKSQAAMIEDLDVLQSLILKVGLAQTAEEAQEYLISWPETYDGHE